MGIIDCVEGIGDIIVSLTRQGKLVTTQKYIAQLNKLRQVCLDNTEAQEVIRLQLERIKREEVKWRRNEKSYI